MYNKILLFVIILIITITVLIYIKSILIYNPTCVAHQKYDKFYAKLSHLVESEHQITNYFVKTKDNLLLDTLYIENPDTEKCVIYFHGNTGNLSMRFDMIKILYNFASIIIFDYRSYGKSNGRHLYLSSHGLLTDADAIWNFTTNRLKIKPNNISLFGESLGCSVAIYLASKLSKNMNNENYPHSIILNSPFYSLESMIKKSFEKFRLDFFGNILKNIFGREYKSNEWLKLINHQTKIIIAHSINDEIIPYEEGLNLYNSLNQIHPFVKFIAIDGSHYNLCLSDNYLYALSELFYD